MERMVLAKGNGASGLAAHVPCGKPDAVFERESAIRSVSRGGELLPEVRQVIALAAKDCLTPETGHSSAAEGLLLARAAREQG